MSYGVIAIQAAADPKEIRYLVIRRKDSLSYVEFLRGKYKPTNHAYIQLLCNEMTVSERSRLLTGTFSTLWNELWNGQHTRQFRNEAASAQALFEALKTTGDSEGKLLSAYMAACTTHYEDPEWGFPKGRRNLRESDMRCAVREWHEETGLPEGTLHLMPDIRPCEEEYIGSNGIPYKQMYYIGCCKKDTPVSVRKENAVMAREIGGIGWYTIEEAMTLIRLSNSAKREMLQQLHRRIAVGDLHTVCGSTI
jgi:8-oxo-dGTP pyrophosphatase MutT (NUDIX family)